MTDIQLISRGLRGESLADIARREGSIGGVSVSPTNTDQEVIDLATAGVALTGANAYVSTAAGLAAVGEGESFWVADGSGLALYRDLSGVATPVAPFTSAANISKTGGGTVQDALTALDPITIEGASGARTVAIGEGAWGTGEGDLNVLIGQGAGALIDESAGGLHRATGLTFVGAGVAENAAFQSDFATAVGHMALNAATKAYCFVGVGLRVGYNLAGSDSNGAYCTFLGCDAGLGATTLRNSVLVGSKAGLSIDSGTTPIGAGTGSTGDSVVGVGVGCLTNLTSGSFLTAIGADSMGGGATITANGSTAVGFRALQALTSGGSNDAFGYEAGKLISTGTSCSIFGSSAGGALTTQYGAALFGAGAGAAATANETTCIGYLAGTAATTSNTFVGANAGKAINSGSGHVVVGRNAMPLATTAIRNVVLGEDAYSGSTNYSTCVVIGWNAQPTASNQITLGDSSITELRCQQTTITALSDKRFKKDIKAAPDGLGLALLRDLPIRTFRWKTVEGNPIDDRLQIGMIAQEWDEVLQARDLDWMGVISKNDPKRWEAAPHKLFFSALISIQELADAIDGQAGKMASLEARVDELERA